jgi:hypothetical protein
MVDDPITIRGNSKDLRGGNDIILYLWIELNSSL